MRTMRSLVVVNALAMSVGMGCENEDAPPQGVDVGLDTTAVSDVDTALPTRGVFVVDEAPSGGGLVGMDALCNADASRPDTALNYRALLASPSRYPCTSPNCEEGAQALDWPLVPSTRYLFNGAVSFTTDADAIVTETPNALLEPGGVNTWSGGTRDWQVAENHCNDWTVSDDSTQGSLGWTGGPPRADFFGGHGNFDCDRSLPLICVEVDG